MASARGCRVRSWAQSSTQPRGVRDPLQLSSGGDAPGSHAAEQSLKRAAQGWGDEASQLPQRCYPSSSLTRDENEEKVWEKPKKGVLVSSSIFACLLPVPPLDLHSSLWERGCSPSTGAFLAAAVAQTPLSPRLG